MPRFLCALLCLCTVSLPLQASAAVSTVTYTPPDWPMALQGDLERPAGPGPFPVILMVHGGGWARGTREDRYQRDIGTRLVSAGYAVFYPSYRLAPTWRYPAPVEDLQMALRWLAAQGRALNLDSGRLGAWGYSAGAHLVSLLGSDVAADPTLPRLRAVVAGGTPADLTVWPRSALVRDFIGSPYETARARWAEASPVNRVTARAASFFLYHGRWDTLVEPEQADRLAQALASVGRPAEIHYVPFRGHILTALYPGQAYEAALRFLNRELAADETVRTTPDSGSADGASRPSPAGP